MYYSNAVFKYKKGLDSVLVVNGEAYNKCNTTNPIQTLNDENPIFKFTRSGPFFFISGHNDKCENGEKLIVAVMAVRHHKIMNSSTTAAPTPAPAPALALAPGLAPSATLQTADGKIVQAPAPAPANSGAAYIGSGGFLGLIWGLGLSLILV